MTYVKSEVVKRTKNTIKGHFKLSDKSITFFSIDKEHGGLFDEFKQYFYSFLYLNRARIKGKAQVTVLFETGDNLAVETFIIFAKFADVEPIGA